MLCVKLIISNAVIYIYKENGGKHTAFNVGIKESIGDIFVCIDDDDRLSVNALEDKMFAIHSLFRNEDLSVNLGDLLRVVDDKLLTFVEGNPIGAVLNKTSID